MSSTTAPMRISDIQWIVRESANHTTRDLARMLNELGVPVPRDGATDNRSAARKDGHVLPTFRSNPGRWNAAAVEAVLAAPEADPANHWAAARATLGSDVTATLTIG